MRLLIKSRPVVRWYFVVLGVLLVAHLVTWAVAAAGYPHQFGMRDRFDFDREATVPAMFASLSLLLCGVLLAVVASHFRERGETAWNWALLAVVFAFLSLDEATSLHEMLVSYIRRFIETSGPLRFAWIIPYGIAVIAGLVIYWPWLRALPTAIQRRFILAAILYLGGALGMEMVGGQMQDWGYRDSNWYALATTIEELLEFAGVGVFLGGLLMYLEQLQADVAIGFSEPTASA